MDVKIEAAPMVAEAEIVEPVVTTTEVVNAPDIQANCTPAVASSSCPSMGSHSISAVAPDTYFRKELANAA